jgi:hypothetical protein
MFFKNNNGKEKLFRNSNSDLIEDSKRLILSNITGTFFSEEKILIDPHGLNMLKTSKKDGDIYFGEKLNDVNI